MNLLGKNNPRVKALLRLTRRRHREEEQKFIIESYRMVAEALSSTWPIEAIYCTPKFQAGSRGQEILAVARSRNVDVYVIPPEVLNRVATVEEPQGILAVVYVRKSSLEELLRPSPPLVVVVDGVQDPGNLGTIIRTAYAAGASGALLIEGTVDVYNLKTVRATAGAIFHFPVAQGVPLNKALDFIERAGLRLIVADPRGATSLYEANFCGPTAVVVGGEGAGPRPEVYGAALHRVFIPMQAKTESLNVAVAAALLIYEAVRQRHGNRPNL